MDLNRFAALIGGLWSNPSCRLHGILIGRSVETRDAEKSDEAGAPYASVDFVLFSIGEVLRKVELQFAGPGRVNQHALGASFSLRDHVELLVRSTQLLGESITKSIELDESRQIAINEHRDIKLYADSILFYFSMLCNDMAMIISAIFRDGGFPNQDYDNLTALIEAAQQGDSNYTSLISGADLSWFTTLSWRRNHRVHRSATQVLGGPNRVDGIAISPSMTIQLSGREFISGDLLADIKVISGGFFSFLDYVTREIDKRIPATATSNEGYTEIGRIPVLGDSSFLKTIIPVVDVS